jgi:aspartate oxidase
MELIEFIISIFPALIQTLKDHNLPHFPAFAPVILSNHYKMGVVAANSQVSN